MMGNLTKDPELRYTPQGTPVCGFRLATNREWVTGGVKKEAADFHNVVAWNKLAELCAQLLVKGTKVYIEGRLQHREWNDDAGNKKYKTEIVIDEMIVLSNSSKSDTVNSESTAGTETDTSSNDGEFADELDLDQVLGDTAVTE